MISGYLYIRMFNLEDADKILLETPKDLFFQSTTDSIKLGFPYTPRDWTDSVVNYNALVRSLSQQTTNLLYVPALKNITSYEATAVANVLQELAEIDIKGVQCVQFPPFPDKILSPVINIFENPSEAKFLADVLVTLEQFTFRSYLDYADELVADLKNTTDFNNQYRSPFSTQVLTAVSDYIRNLSGEIKSFNGVDLEADNPNIVASSEQVNDTLRNIIAQKQKEDLAETSNVFMDKYGTYAGVLNCYCETPETPQISQWVRNNGTKDGHKHYYIPYLVFSNKNEGGILTDYTNVIPNLIEELKVQNKLIAETNPATNKSSQ